MRESLRAMSPDERHRQSDTVCDRLRDVSAVKSGTTVLVYFALPFEVNIDSLIQNWLVNGVVVAAPRVDWSGATMTAARLTNLSTGLISGRHGTREPSGAQLVDPEQIDLAVIPGLAFDAEGGRLGRGGGFYDRFLAELRRVSDASLVGVAFDEQIVPRIPMEEHDVPVQTVVTPSGWFGPDAARFTG